MEIGEVERAGSDLRGNPRARRVAMLAARWALAALAGAAAGLVGLFVGGFLAFQGVIMIGLERSDLLTPILVNAVVGSFAGWVAVFVASFTAPRWRTLRGPLFGAIAISFMACRGVIMLSNDARWTAWVLWLAVIVGAGVAAREVVQHDRATART